MVIPSTIFSLGSHLSLIAGVLTQMRAAWRGCLCSRRVCLTASFPHRLLVDQGSDKHFYEDLDPFEEGEEVQDNNSVTATYKIKKLKKIKIIIRFKFLKEMNKELIKTS